MSAPRIDSLQPGDRIVLQFPAGIGHATFILHSGEGEDRTATFSQHGTDGPELWDAYRHKKRWVYGTAQTPLKVLGRALPPPAAPGRKSTDWVNDDPEVDATPVIHVPTEVFDQVRWADRNFTPEQQEIAERIAEDPRVHIAPAYTPEEPPEDDYTEFPDEDPELIDPEQGGLHHRPFSAPNPTCACGNDATVIPNPEHLPNLAVCAECAEALKDGAP